MSAQLHELRAAAARRRQQTDGSRVPLQSPAASDCDADNMSLHSLRSAANSRRSNLSRHSQLMSVATTKSEQFDSTLSEYLRPSDLEPVSGKSWRAWSQRLVVVVASEEKLQVRKGNMLKIARGKVGGRNSTVRSLRTH